MRLKTIFMEAAPVPKPLHKGVPEVPLHLIKNRKQQQQLTGDFLHWVSSNMGLSRVTQKLETYWQLDSAALVAEVKRAGAKSLSPAARKALLDEHAGQVSELRPILAKARRLEIELQHRIFDLYGLTQEEIQLLRSTAPRATRWLWSKTPKGRGNCSETLRA